VVIVEIGEWMPLAGLAPEHQQLVAHLNKVRQDNGPISLRQIGERLHLAHSRVQQLLVGKALPADELQVRHLVRAGLGGSVEDADQAAHLLARVPRQSGRRNASTWVWAGPEAREHFTRRGYGQRSGGQGGDLFRGRLVALSRVQRWLLAETCPGQPLVVAGRPGTGKSALVARAVLNLNAAGYGPGLAIHARDATHADVLAAIATVTGHPGGVDRFTLVEALAQASEQPVRPIVIDALDEAHSKADRAGIVQTIVELAGLPCMRVVVATRSLAVGDRHVRGSLLADLHVTGPDSPNLVDLDDAASFDHDALIGFAEALLTQHGVPRPGPPGRAWQRYRNEPELARRLATKIADRADRSFLVVALAGHMMATAAAVIDPDSEGFTATAIPASIREAISKYLDLLPDRDRVQLRGLLTALAYARGVGIDDPTWIRFAAALGYPTTTVDLDRLRDSAAADYLLQTSPDPVGEPVTRLFHEALVEDLRAPRSSRQISDERAILTAIRPAQADNWDRASLYAQTHAAEHAASANCLPELLQDPRYLAVADLDRLLPTLPTRPTSDLAPVAAVLRRASARARTLHPHRRTRLLALTAAHLGHRGLQRRITAVDDHPFVVRWAHGLGSGHLQMLGHVGWIGGVAVGRLGDRDVVVSGGRDKTVRIWDEFGNLIGSPLTGHTGWVTAVAIGRLGDRDVIVSSSHDNTVRMWDQHGRPIGEPLTGHTSHIEALAVGRLGDQDVIVSGGGDGDGTIRVWDQHGHLIGEPAEPDLHSVAAVAVGRLGSQDIIVAGGGEGDGSVRMWDQHGNLIADPFGIGFDCVMAVAVGRLGDQDVVVSCGDRTAHVRDQNGRPVGEPLSVNGSIVTVAVGRLDGQDVIVAGGIDNDGTARIWAWNQDGNLVGKPLAVHNGWVGEVAVGRLGDRDVIAFYISSDTADDDEAVRVWDQHCDSIGAPLNGHVGMVHTAAAGRLGNREVIVSAGYDETLQLWDESGQPAGASLVGHSGWVGAVAVGRLGDHDVVVSGGGKDQKVRVWNHDGQPVGDPLAGHTGSVVAIAMGRLGDRDVIVSGSRDGTARMWDQHGQPIGDPLTGHSGWVRAVAVGRLGDRDVVVSGGDDTVQIWDQHGKPIGDPLTGHTDLVMSVIVGRLGDRDVVVTGGDDTVQIWDQHGKPIGDPLTGHTDWVHTVALGRFGDHDAIISGSRDGTVRVWDWSDQSESMTIDFLEPVNAICLVRSVELYVASGRSLSRLDLVRHGDMHATAHLRLWTP
jgi:WD40 repeat protein